MPTFFGLFFRMSESDFDRLRETSLLENMMFSLYEYDGRPDDNPMRDLVDAHFDTLAAKYPDTVLKLLIVTGELTPLSVSVFPCDFSNGTLSDTALNSIMWRTCMITFWYPTWVS